MSSFITSISSTNFDAPSLTPKATAPAQIGIFTSLLLPCFAREKSGTGHLFNLLTWFTMGFAVGTGHDK